MASKAALKVMASKLALKAAGKAGK
jgi:hypothetical protein